MMKKKLKTEEAAAMVGMNVNDLRGWARSGKCPFAVAYKPEGSTQYKYQYSEGGIKRWKERGLT